MTGRPRLTKAQEQALKNIAARGLFTGPWKYPHAHYKRLAELGLCTVKPAGSGSHHPYSRWVQITTHGRYYLDGC